MNGCICTKMFKTDPENYLYWSYIERISHSPIKYIASLGHSSREAIKAFWVPTPRDG